MARPKILIATGIFPPQVGGPAKYAQNLSRVFEEKGYTVAMVTYGKAERALPPGLRHVFFFFRLCLKMPNTRHVLALDTYSVGMPAYFAAALFQKHFSIRIGGDFLWESYVERTRKKTLLSQFYSASKDLSLKERIIFFLTKYILKRSDALVFTTPWLRDIFKDAYPLSGDKLSVVENHIDSIKNISGDPSNAEKIFLSSSRPIFLKNQEVLAEAFRNARSKDPTLRLVSELLLPAELQKTLERAYAVIVPSLSEVSPNLILEAISHGKPFIVTKDCGLKDQVADIALFIDPLSVSDIEEKILLLSSEAFYQAQQQKVANWRHSHTWDEIGDEFIGILKRHSKSISTQ